MAGTSAEIESRGYAHPEALVTTSWVAEHLNDPSIRIVESDEDVLLYDTGHVPGSVKIDWHADLNDALQRDYLTAERFAELLGAKGITPDTTVVFYGDKYNWIKLHMPEYPQEGALRGGHIPTAKNVPWARAANPDTGEFRNADELKAIYEGEIGLKKGDDVIAYCRIGERSSHTWFVLKYLLGYDKVRNYDGSWTEWGNLVRAPIEK